VDNSAAPHRSHLEIATALLDAGVRVLQLRDKSASDGALRETTGELLPLVHSRGAQLVLNDRLELASEFSGLGVHLGQDDASPTEARLALGPEVLIGWSTHDLSQVAAAQSLPLDYIGFGPVFGAAGKHRCDADPRTPMSPRGTDLLAEAVHASALPVVAIGGINDGNLDAILQTNVRWIAAISSVTQAEDMLRAATYLDQHCRARKRR